jgi:hypothetical protein
VYKVESWDHDVPKSYKAVSFPTAVRAGQLRILREGTTVRCLVADDPANNFRELHRVEMGSEDLEHLRFEVVTVAAPERRGRPPGGPACRSGA